ncbi:MAG: His-Xaa-Ser system radical SAM maturase HxsB [Candidatus Moranbacteria bacterium]|nr:His-Xaa-Ser system radical SAM maturase HxsB [Candidatus Moranbacteria bacterium]
MKFNPDKIDHSTVGFFRYRKLGKEYLLTNDAGEYAFLDENNFGKFIEGKISSKSASYKELAKKNFIRDKINFDKYIEKYQKKHQNLFGGPSLHIVVVTLRCNYSCVYCQASAKGVTSSQFDMSLGTAKQVVDFIFSTPNNNVAIEFQGGEPLLNWPIVKFIVEYAKEKNKIEKKSLELRLVSNFSLMDKEKLRFFFRNHVALCTSLDGPEAIHNRNRPLPRKNSYEETTKWLKQAMDEYRRIERKKIRGKYYFFQPGALVTVSRFSLEHPKEIVDEYLKWGFDTIFLRPLSPLGTAGKAWSKMGYKPQEYLDFYKKALDYILEINQSGKRFYERTASIVVSKILTDDDPNYLELRSPCGAGIGQLAYDFNGDIYTCDEGRMMGYSGQEMFRLGTVAQNVYSEIIDSPALKSMCVASETSCQAGCSHCVYQPYCGICPIHNFAETGNVFCQQPNSLRCIINKSIFDLIFSYLKDKKKKKILEKWAKKEIECSKKNYQKIPD